MENFRELAGYLQQHRLTLVTAESCTAGLIAAKLADCPGAAKCLEGGFIAYTPDAKQRYLQVSVETIKRYSLTSEKVAIAMALGALRNSKATLAIASTGVAGPEAASDGTPPGKICLAWVFAINRLPSCTQVFAETFHFDGGRREVLRAAVKQAWNMIPVYHAQCLQRVQTLVMQ